MNNTYTLPATFRKENVANELTKIERWLKTTALTGIDCAKVNEIDSSGIAALVYLLADRNCTLENISTPIQKLCSIYQVNLQRI